MDVMLLLILLDIDGTLLNSKHSIEKRTIEDIACYSNKNRIILTSARKPSSIRNIAKILKLQENIIICYNGALVMDGDSKIFERSLPIDTVLYICKIAKKHSLSVNIYSNDLWFTETMDDFVLHEATILCESPILLESSIEKLTVHKILLMGSENNLQSIKEELSKINNLKLCNSKLQYLEITCSYASKKRAFEFLLQYLSFDSKNTLAIGDGFNDLELLECVQIGIAMDNAPDAVKKIADYITASNNENGVGNALRKYVSNSSSFQ